MATMSARRARASTLEQLDMGRDALVKAQLEAAKPRRQRAGVNSHAARWLLARNLPSEGLADSQGL